jgi:hypothetical protein
VPYGHGLVFVPSAAGGFFQVFGALLATSWALVGPPARAIAASEKHGAAAAAIIAFWQEHDLGPKLRALSASAATSI